MAALEYRVADVQEAAGWTDTTLLGLALEYIERQDDDDPFVDFLTDRLAEEQREAAEAADQELSERVAKIKAPAHDDDWGED